MIRKLLILTALIGCGLSGYTQEETDLKVGDVLEFAPQKNENYSFIDLYVKTRQAPHDLSYDSLTGDGFYEYFFHTGDFDVSRLPSSYQGKRAKIAAFRLVSDESGNTRTIVLAVITPDKEVVWLEAEAFVNEEVYLLVP